MNIDDKIKIMLKGAVQHTDIKEIKNKLMQFEKTGEKLKVKLGLDPSAPDIHLGHAVVLRKMKQLQDIGCEIIIIIGDFTGMIGDPTGKSKTRKQLSKKEVQINAKTYQDQIFKIIDPEHTKVFFNSEWLSKLNFEDVISLASKCTVARMLERDDFAKRQSEHKPISIHEFFYPLMQAYDSVAIEADIEMGGTDQVFNVLMGRKIQRDFGQDPQLTLFFPILEGIDGVKKMSKSLDNYIGINESATVMYEKIMKIPDNLIIKFYELCTDVHTNEIEKIKEELTLGKNPRDVKMDLAREITSLYHTKEDVYSAINHFKDAYQKGKAPDNIPRLVINVCQSKSLGELIINQLVEHKFYKSKGEIRRLFKQNAVSINGNKVIDPDEIKIANNNDILKIGKAKYFCLNIN